MNVISLYEGIAYNVIDVLELEAYASPFIWFTSIAQVPCLGFHEQRNFLCKCNPLLRRDRINVILLCERIHKCAYFYEERDIQIITKVLE